MNWFDVGIAGIGAAGNIFGGSGSDAPAIPLPPLPPLPGHTIGGLNFYQPPAAGVAVSQTVILVAFAAAVFVVLAVTKK